MSNSSLRGQGSAEVMESEAAASLKDQFPSKVRKKKKVSRELIKSTLPLLLKCTQIHTAAVQEAYNAQLLLELIYRGVDSILRRQTGGCVFVAGNSNISLFIVIFPAPFYQRG